MRTAPANVLNLAQVFEDAITYLKLVPAEEDVDTGTTEAVAGEADVVSEEMLVGVTAYTTD